jgi:hypothetical protein
VGTAGSEKYRLSVVSTRGPDDVSEAQHRDVHILAPPRETADVALDLDRIRGIPSGRYRVEFVAFGEHRLIQRAGTTYRAGGLHDQPGHRRRLLAGRQKLHGANDVHLFDRASTAAIPAGARRVGAGRSVHHGIDVGRGDHLGERITQVGAHELGAPHSAQQFWARRHGVHRENTVDLRIGRESNSQPPADESAGSGDQDRRWRHAAPAPRAETTS